MRITRVLAVAALTLLLAACYPTLSVHPLYREGDAVRQPKLEGVWGDQGEKALEMILLFEASDDGSYLLTCTSEGKVTRVRVHLVELGGWLFMDAFPEKESREQLGRSEVFPHLISAHAFYRLRVEGDTLHYASLRHEWLKRKIEAGEIDIAHTLVHGKVVLTDTPDELQDLVRHFASDPEAFADSEPFTRLSAAPAD